MVVNKFKNGIIIPNYGIIIPNYGIIIPNYGIIIPNYGLTKSKTRRYNQQTFGE